MKHEVDAWELFISGLKWFIGAVFATISFMLKKHLDKIDKLQDDHENVKLQLSVARWKRDIFRCSIYTS
jgi:hypothetical protein